MALWPSSTLGFNQTGGTDTSTSLPATVTSSGTAHTKGAWTELIASSEFNATGLWLRVHNVRAGSGLSSPGLIDIGVGAAASEQVIIENLFNNYDVGPISYWLPLVIPYASRISVRWQTLALSATITVSCSLVSDGGQAPTVATTYGADTATSGGVALPTGMAANTKSAWTQVTAAMTSPARYLVPLISPTSTDPGLNTTDMLFDFGIGAASSETLVLRDVPVSSTNNETFFHPRITVPVNIRAGSRLAVRYQKTTTVVEPPHVAAVCFS